MWAVEYNNKYHNGAWAIPCATKEEAEIVYNTIKAKIGIDIYQLNKKGEGTLVEVKSLAGISSIDISCVAAVWIVDTENKIVEEWRKECKKLKNIQESKE